MMPTFLTKTNFLNEIRELTGNSDLGINMDSPFIDSLKETINEDDLITKDSLNGDIDSNIMRQVIGKGGYYFHLTTKNTNCYFIWYSITDNKIYIWGNSESVSKAKGILNHRLQIVKARNQECNIKM